MRRLSGLIELIGFALIVAAGFLVAPALGCAVAGIGLVAWAVAAERGGPPPGEEAP